MAIAFSRGWARDRFRPRLRAHLTPWTLVTFAIVALVLLPLASVLLGIFGESSDTWRHLASTVLADYLGNSAILALGVGVLTLVIGVGTAWLVATCEFPGRRFLETGLILPLAMPTYIMAYTYAEVLSHSGPVQGVLQIFLDPVTTASIRTGLMSLPGAVFILSLVLYPYVYLITRASFLKQSGGILETSRILGKSGWASFRQVALPMARPAVVAGVTLVLMEVLNEYGAVKYFGVSTFTTGIFRAWFSLGDTPSAIRLSACLLAFVFLLILAERAQRGRARFDHGSSRFRPVAPFRLRGARAWLATGACTVPVVLGFVVPVGQLLVWTAEVVPEALDRRFLWLALNSFGLALVSALIAVAAALIIVYSVRLSPTPLLRLASRASSLGYSIPGAVIAVGVLVPFIWVDRRLLELLAPITGSGVGLLLTGTVAALVFAYVVRFLAVALNPVDSGFERICGNLDETSRSLGSPPLRTLRRVNVPLLKGTLLSAGLLVFVDVLKELPLTLILRPFDFDTLATRAFQLAMDEQVAESALPALLIVMVGLLPVVLINRLIGRERGETGGPDGEEPKPKATGGVPAGAGDLVGAAREGAGGAQAT
ncbi:MAG: iron ABC transporter permease [Gemmatimonadales bacterium]|nr:MAG: iron ABC transporter permease [Gemmatimonadales bacterium]